jgi:hypothetical protein
MKYKFYILYCFLLLSPGVFGQQPVQKGLKIVDTLSPEEKKLQNRVILQREVDSIIADYMKTLPKQADDFPVQQATVKANNTLPVALSLIIILMLGSFFAYYYRQQKKTGQLVAELPPSKKSKSTPQALEAKIAELKNELLSLGKENENLNRVIKEYNGIQHEYDSLKHNLLKAYKVKYYPGYDKSKQDMVAMQGVFNTERSVSAYAYEKFLKPILAIADANKNSPARTSPADKARILDLLVSLSLLYIEYLYLRVNDLSIGGKMVQRIQGFEKGNGIDAALLNKLDTEFGSRALVIKLALEKAGLDKLAYPVFDETNLNN